MSRIRRTASVLTDDPLVVAETTGDLAEPRTAFGWIVAGLRERRRRGIPPFTVMSCDNILGNGAVARLSVEAVARLTDPALADWIASEVAFPSTMVDRITPVTIEADRERIRERLSVEDAWPVASEPFAQWVIEDNFPLGRPAFEAVGATVVDDVHSYEAIKIRLLNGGHQAVALVGQLAGYTFVHEALGDPRIEAFVRDYMVSDGVPTLAVPEGLISPATSTNCSSAFEMPPLPTHLPGLAPTRRIGYQGSSFRPCWIGSRTVRMPVPARGSSQVGGSSTGRPRAAHSASTTNQPTCSLRRRTATPFDFLMALPTLAPVAASEGFVAAYLEAVRQLEGGGVDALLSR